MVDKVKTLKLEDSTSGTEFNFTPTETDPAEDYLAAKGIALENEDATLIDKAGDGQIQFTDAVNATKKVSDLLDAEQEVFDPTGTDLVSTLTGPAIRELRNKVSNSASPGFSFGKSGNIPNGTWLLRPGSVPSNKAGITVGFINPEILKIVTATENLDTYDITVYEHEGDEVNLTSLVTKSVVAARSSTFDVTISMTTGRQLAIKVTAGSAKNIGVDLQLGGDFA